MAEKHNERQKDRIKRSCHTIVFFLFILIIFMGLGFRKYPKPTLPVQTDILKGDLTTHILAENGVSALNLRQIAHTDENRLYDNLEKEKYQKLIDLFNKIWDSWTNKEEKRDRGLPLLPLDTDIVITPIKHDRFINPPVDAAYQGKDRFRGYLILVSKNKKRLYLSRDNNFSRYFTVNWGEEIPVISHFYFEKVESSKVKFLYVRFKYCYNIIRPLIEMYRITNDKKYLDPARNLLYHLIARIDEDGLYRNPFPHLPLKYRAMYQSNLMQILFDYNQLAPEKNKDFELALDSLAKAYRFTDVGTRDHRLEAQIGLMLVDRLGVKKFDSSAFDKDLNNLYNLIRKYNGRIPMRVKPLSEPPLFNPNYQNYNTYLLVVIAAKYTRKDIGLKEIFPLIFEQAKKQGDIRLFEALYYAKLIFGFDDKEWAQKQERLILNSPYMRGLMVLLKYKILSDNLER
jgi:hypothetical protein